MSVSPQLASKKTRVAPSQGGGGAGRDAGIAGKGNFLVAFIIVMEIVGTKYKMYLGILITVGSSSRYGSDAR